MDRQRPIPGFLRAIRICLPIALSAVLLSSCVSPPDDAPDSGSNNSGSGNGDSIPSGTGQSDGPIASSISSATPAGEDLQVNILSLERHSPDILVLNINAVNKGEEKVRVFNTFAELGGHGTTPNGVSLIDMHNNKRYMPLTLTDGKTCHCSDWDGQQNLAPGGVIDIWAAFPSPPENVELVAVTTPVTPDFLDIPITEAASPDSAIAGAPVAEPRILDLRAFQDDISGDSSRTDSDEETSILLASDVLFDLNESTLTSTADDALQKVAEEIDSVSATTIRVDGYTDNSGNDSINNPLSTDRAKAVETRLKELITRDGVSFEVNGHGSADPVGDNSTEEGRKKNRRVTITFTK